MVRWARNRVAGGDAPWGQDPYGFAQSGELEDSEEGRESWVQTTVTGAGTLKFWWQVSSTEDCHFLGKKGVTS